MGVPDRSRQAAAGERQKDAGLRRRRFDQGRVPPNAMTMLRALFLFAALLPGLVLANPTPEITAKRSKANIEKALKAIEAAAKVAPSPARTPSRRPGSKEEAPKVAAPTPSELAKARTELGRLNGYRYLAGLSHDVKLDEELCWNAKFGAELCRQHGQIDHTPPKPAGMDEATFRRGYEATTSSNLYWTSGADGITGSVDGYMDDSDPSNVRAVGHRRWCLNPPMGKTGFGAVGGFGAMWCMDRSGREARGAIVCYPAAGFHPLAYFKPGTAWSVTLDPERYRLTGRSVRVFELAAASARRFPDDLKGLKEIPLTDVNLDRSGIGSLRQCLIFRPRAKVGRGDRFGVIIEGVEGAPGGRLAYAVEFY